MSDIESWKVGEKVAVFDAYSREPDRVATIEAVHKNGRAKVAGTLYQPASQYGNSSQCGTGWNLSSIHRMTPEMTARVARSQKRLRMKRLANWLEHAPPDDVPQAVLNALLAAHNEAEAKKNPAPSASG